MPDLGQKPLVVYGLKHRPKDGDRCFIIFNCVIPGILVPMKSEIYCVNASQIGPPHFNPQGYVLAGGWEDRARHAGDHVYRLAHALQRTEGLPWLYILPSGFVGMGWKHMEKCAPQVMQKMRQALEDVYGSIQFDEIPGRELWLPSFKEIDFAKEVGALVPLDS